LCGTAIGFRRGIFLASCVCEQWPKLTTMSTEYTKPLLPRPLLWTARKIAITYHEAILGLLWSDARARSCLLCGTAIGFRRGISDDENIAALDMDIDIEI
jgi:hypothetical protein